MYLTTTENGEQLLVTSASDLTRAAECEFRVARDLDARLGRVAAVVDEPDAMLDRTAKLGTAHEEAIIADYVAEFGPDDVVQLARGGSGLDEIAPFVAQTLEALHRGVAVITQATFLDLNHAPAAPGELAIAFVGYADFLVRTNDGAYRVQDSKLARRAKVTALLQLAAYAEQLQKLGVDIDPEVDLILGTRELSIHRLDDIAPVLRARRAPLHRLLRERAAADEPIAWRDPSVTYCRSCAWCTAEIEQHDDVSRVAGLTGAQWSKLGSAGIETLEQLAAHDDRAAAETATEAGISRSTLDTLRLQAELQRQAQGAEPGTAPPVRVRDSAVLHALPAPSPGDLYFDFEGDPLYTETDPTRWGLDYLFGFVDAEGVFTPYWAHSFAEEREALLAFLADVEARRAQHPDLHIYHYAAYERTHLRSLTARHGVGEDVVDDWLRSGVLVDLYPVVRKALRVGTPSYSIKYLEPLYWPEARDGAAVARGDDSVAEYVRSCELLEQGDADAAQQIRNDIADYNEVDCLSTLRLAAWLRGLAAEHPSPPPALFDDEPAPREVPDSPLRTALLELSADADGAPTTEPDRSPEQRAYAYAAAAIDYHRREHKTFWWDHFDRLIAPLDEWADTRDVFVVDTDAAHESTDWNKSGKQRSLRRTLTLHGTWAPGSRPGVTGRPGPFAVYEQPAPLPPSSRDPLARAARSITLEVVADDHVVITETLAAGVSPYNDLPVALTPAAPPPAGQQKPAIEEWGAALVDAHPEWPAEPVGDLLRRVAPRTRSGAPLARVEHDDAGEPDRVAAVVASLLDLDRSYLAVQGPPGTGKTYLGAHVIAELVATHGWKVGVVAQGHATVEHLLDGVVAAGLDGRRVGKAPKSSADPSDYATARWTVLGDANDLSTFTADHPEGFVIGGTAWNFSDPQRVGRRSLDLLVIDEAGQFSLAATIAASVSAKNLLLLGDPQQLPQVSQGTHPEPIDGSALGYLAAGHDVLPAELGYFLAETRRLHPALAKPVSHLSYEGQLHAHPSSSVRELDGVAPGLHPVPVEHHGNATESVDEAEAVVAIIRRLIGTSWTPGAGRSARPFADDDVIVVTPYNAQQQVIRAHLDAARLHGTRVGTVDKFQGQEAAVAIVSLAASSSRDAPRGMEFLLNRNRLNVAISRAQWAAYLVHSRGLLDSLPSSPAGVAELSAFIRLTEGRPAG
ncbi:MAG: TM0106 family RecB-like putative nuclease [Microcella sp.]|uniref:TM0106 family RecB-like putative nuclease n=1 Tax=Microcella sp. TaxID=1913979 RepID=UPI0024C5ED8B|nr:bifunctional RecB family nuclease/DEAD/DEAH box helicase [Microcella sp.]UYN84033.1 MAG: TM0106 family RecB-like putative nuclease [Microcella sp.]